MRKSFLLSSAAVLMTATAGYAADLPAKKAAPVEYVRVCSTEKITGFVIPGTDTCLKIGGYARFQANYTEPTSRVSGPMSYTGLLGVKFDARTQTELGTLIGRGAIEASNTGTVLDHAIVQLGGFSAGYFESLYTFYDSAPLQGQFGASGKPVQVAYTFSAPGGFAATLALEDGSALRSGGNGSLLSGKEGDFLGNPAFGYAGNRMPDVVGVIDYTQSWGALHLAGAVHELSSADADVSTKYAFSVLGGVKFTPTPVDTLYLEAAYTSGQIKRAGLPSVTLGTFEDLSVPDFVVNGTTIKPTTAWTALAAAEHGWTPSLATYGVVAYTDAKVAASTLFDSYSVNTTSFAVGVKWAPVKNLTVQPEIAYSLVNPSRDAVTASTKGTESRWLGAIRVQRDF